jgi:hypothetical protein
VKFCCRNFRGLKKRIKIEFVSPPLYISQQNQHRRKNNC